MELSKVPVVLSLIPVALSRSLRRSAATRSAMLIVAQLTEHCKTLNIVKHHETLVKHHEILKHSPFNATISQLDAENRRSHGVSGDIGEEFPGIDNCGVGITQQMCNRVTNHGDMGTFSKHLRMGIARLK